MRAINFLSIITMLLLAAIILTFKAVSAATPESINVLIIDTGANLAHKAFQGSTVICKTKNDCIDINGHGTGITSLVINGELTAQGVVLDRVCKSVKVEICNYFPAEQADGYFACLDRAMQSKYDFINFSSVSSMPVYAEYLKLQLILNKGTKIIVATGNDGKDLSKEATYPIGYTVPKYTSYPFNKLIPLNGIVAVGALSESGTAWYRSNYIHNMKVEKGVNVKSALSPGKTMLMTGTSASTALYTHRLLVQECARRGLK